MILKTPLEIVYEEILETQDIDAVFRWIEVHGFNMEKKHLKHMYTTGYEHAQNDIFYQSDDEFHRLYPTVTEKIFKP